MSDDQETAPEAETGTVDGEAESADGEATADGEREDLVARVAAEDEDLAADVEARIADLEAEIGEREAELDDRTDQLKRVQADFQNYKKRAKKRQTQLEERATEGLVERLLDVRDNLNRAVESEHEDVTSLKEGVEMTLREFDRVLEDENVAEIAPETGSDVDPGRHEVLMRVESEQEEGTVAEVYQPGYEMGEKVLRAAQVTVSDGTGSGDGE